MLKSLFLKMCMVLLVTTLAFSGCTRQAPESPEEITPVDQEVEDEVPADQEVGGEVPANQDEGMEDAQEKDKKEELPEKVETTILIEGMEEDMILLLFQEDAIPFYTYYPADMLFEHWIYDDEKGVRFFANFGGTINKNAFVEVKLFPVKAVGNETDFVNRISGESGLFANRGVEWVEKESELERIFPWSIIEYYYLNDEFTGSLYLGLQGDDYFYIDVHYPWEYGDGMESRASIIMKEFLWTEQLQRLTE